jgi:pimeloyl-ACP methyl ester carboxylesterase
VGRKAVKARRIRPWLAVAGLGIVTAAVIHHRARRAERHHPPIGRLLDIDGVRTHVYAVGQGQPVVLLHGNGAMIHDWIISGLIDRLRGSYRVIAIDRPGSGFTERPRSTLWTPPAQAELIDRTLRRLGLENPIIVGHSWGALVALALALKRPGTLKGLLLLSGYYFPTKRLDVLAFSPPALPVIGDAMRYTVSPVITRLLAPGIITRLFAPNPVPRRFEIRFPLDLALRPSQLRASAEDLAFMVPAAARLQHRYGGLALPVAVMTGDGDEIVTPARQSMRLHRTIPGSTLKILPGLGHMIHYSAADEIAIAIDALASGPRSREERSPTRSITG